ncbi:MAG: helix-turn-helix domain-containing protein [Gallintestinimicrobium sp.]
MGNFNDMLKYLRVREKMSQAELADKLGVSKSTVGMYELGKREPDFETLEAIADLFNVDMNFLLGKVGSELSPKDERDIAKDLNRIMTEIKKGNNGPLYYNGIEMDDASINLLQNAIEYALRETKKKTK